VIIIEFSIEIQFELVFQKNSNLAKKKKFVKIIVFFVPFGNATFLALKRPFLPKINIKALFF